jgi:predicted enzyme related to lactoylglutathione lyase
VYVEDLNGAVNFYRDVLGFEPLGGATGVNFEFATSGPPLVLHRGSRTAEAAGMAGIVPSFQIESGIEQLIEIYRRRGVRIVKETQEVSHGWIAFIADLEGNVIQIYQAKESKK